MTAADLRRLAQRMRVPLGFVLAPLFLVFAKPTLISLFSGAVIAAVGLLIRAWASGHLRKMAELTTSGPYAHTRNPLYFGSFLIACGFAIAAHWALLIFVFVFWLLIYGPTIARERTKMVAMFPDSYPEFERQVPPFFPRFLPWRGGGEGAAFSPALYMRHGEWRAALGYLGTMTWLVLRLRGVV